jgi:hypothetical protein
MLTALQVTIQLKPLPCERPNLPCFPSNLWFLGLTLVQGFIDYSWPPQPAMFSIQFMVPGANFMCKVLHLSLTLHNDTKPCILSSCTVYQTNMPGHGLHGLGYCNGILFSLWSMTTCMGHFLTSALHRHQTLFSSYSLSLQYIWYRTCSISFVFCICNVAHCITVKKLHSCSTKFIILLYYFLNADWVGLLLYDMIVS